MEFSKPSLQTLITRIQSDIASRLGIGLPIKKASILSALASAMAGSVFLLYGSVEYWLTQWFIDTATGIHLDRLAGLFGMIRNGKTQAQGTIRIEGTSGKLIQKDALLSTPEGETYSIKNDVTINDQGFVHVVVTASAAGPAGNLKSNSILKLITSISEVKRDALVLEIIGGFEEENDDQLRVRLLKRLRHPGQGGSEADYIHWAQSISGVGNVWVTPDPKSFSIFLSFLTIDADYPLPTDDLRQSVEASLKTKKPLGTRVFVQKLDPVPIFIEIKIFIEIMILDQKDVETKLEKALKNYFLKKVSPGNRIPLIHITQLVSQILKHDHFKIVSPESDILISPNQIGVFGGLKCSYSQS